MIGVKSMIRKLLENKGYKYILYRRRTSFKDFTFRAMVDESKLFSVFDLSPTHETAWELLRLYSTDLDDFIDIIYPFNKTPKQVIEEIFKHTRII